MMFPSLKVQRDTSSGIIRSNTMIKPPSTGTAELERLLQQPPRQVDCSALKAELDAVRCDVQCGDSGSYSVEPSRRARLLEQGRAKYKYAERSQRAARTKGLVSEVQELMEVALSP